MNDLVHIAESKEQAQVSIPIGKRFRKDTWIDDDAYEEMIVAKSRLLKDFPFWGILGLSLVLVEDTSGFIPTLATDGRHIFYNAEFMKSLKRGERTFAVAHELYHCLFNHAGLDNRGSRWFGIREGETDPAKIQEMQEKSKLWNYAVDFVTNDDLLQSNCGEFIRTIKILHNPEFRGMASEQVYQHLLEHPEDRPENGQQTLDTHIEIEIVEDDDEGEGGMGGDGDGSQSKGKGEGQSGAQDGEGDGKGGSYKIKMKRSEYEKMKQEWKDNAVKAAAAQKEAKARGGAGDIPAGIQRLLDDLTKPVYNWKMLLRRYVMSTMSRAYSFARPNKALFSAGFTIPGFRSRTEKLDICICVDTSGSIGQDELTMFVSEMDGILKSFPNYNITAWCFDSAVIEDSITQITKHNGHMDDITKFARNIGGGGGTNFEVNWTFMKDQKLKPKLLLMLTDGQPFGGWGDSLFCPTMFLVIGNPGAKAPFGITMHYEDAM